ncbi:MAG: hypothetical protein OK442_06885 [Thaumarchaeota archaeon]|nr:hypothetical protein [Nitrososphaerota archaeon]
MSESVQNQVKDEVIVRTLGKVSEKVVDKTIEVLVGRLGRTKKSIALSFTLFYRFYNDPPYDETITQLDQTLAEFRMRSSKEILEYKERKYQQTFAVREITDPMAPFIANPADGLDMEEFLSSELRSSSAVIYLGPLVDEALKTEQFESLIGDTLDFSKVLRAGLDKRRVPILKEIAFCKLTVSSAQMTELMDELRKVIPNVEATVAGDEKRSVTVALTDRSMIGVITAALEKAL